MTPGYHLIRLLSFIVPTPLRDEWLREWHGELHSVWGLHGVRRRTRFSAYLRCFGALEDAFWLRVRWRERRMLIQDLRYSFRTFARAPFFPAVVIVTLALGIGANTAIFSLVDTVLLKPMPVTQPETLTDIWTTCRRGYEYCSSSYPDFLDYRRQSSNSFTDMALFTPIAVSLADRGSARMVDVMLVSGNYFSMLGVGVTTGRLLVPDDDILGNPSTGLVLSHRMWTRDFGGDPNAIGRDIRLNGVPFTIVGVAPRGFRGTRLGNAPDAWAPITTTPLIVDGRPGTTTSQSGPADDRLAERDSRWIGGIVARRKTGVTVEQARADMASLSDRLRESYPTRGPRTVTVEATRTLTLPADSREDIVRFVWLLMAVVSSALVIACANIANLFLARANARRKEMGLRMALGAGRSRLIRQLLTESLVLSVVGGALGIAVAYAGLDLISGFSLPGFVSIAALEPAVDRRVLTFTAAVAIATGLAFGLAPAARASKQSLTSSLKDAAETQPAGYGTRAVLLTVQTALASVLLIGAGLFVRSLQNGLATDVGFETRRLAVLGFDLSVARYDGDRARGFLQELTARAERTPGVTSVTSAVWPPLAQGGSGFFASIDGYQPAPDEEIRIEANWVGASFFTVMGIPLRSGRDIEPVDRAGAPRVAVINETMAKKYWADVDPVGRTFHTGPDGSGPQITVIGVARDVMDGLTQLPQPFVYYPVDQAIEQALRRSFYVLAKTDIPPASVLASLSGDIEQLDPNVPVAERTTLENRFAEYLMPQRMGSFLLTTFGGLTVMLSMIGIAGVVTFGVTRRRKEIGIRMALGAARGHVLRTVTRGALVPVAIGVVTGLVAAVGVSRFAQAFLFDVAPTDPITYLGVGLVMTAIAIVAALIPARRATTVNPTEALRSE